MASSNRFLLFANLVVGLACWTACSNTPAPNVVNAPSKLLFTSLPTQIAAGEVFNPAVKVALFNGEGKLDTAFKGTVRLSLGGNASLTELEGTLTADAVDGVATFADLKLQQPAFGYTLRAATEGVETVESLAFTVTGDVPNEDPLVHRLRFTSLPERVMAEELFTPVVRVGLFDSTGKLDTSFTGPVRVSLGGNSTLSDLQGTLTVAAVAGVATFSDLKIARPGTGYTLRAAADGVETVESLAFTVTGEGPVELPPSGSKLLFTSLPSRVVAGEVFSPVKVGLFDGQGKPDASFNGVVRLSLGGNATLTDLDGTITAVAVNGVATFSDLKLTRAATGYTLRAGTDGVETAESLAFSVVPAAPATATFLTQPPNVVAGVTFEPPIQIELRDAFGNLATNATAPVTLALLSNDASVPNALLGNVTVAPALGKALFADVAPTLAGTSLRLALSVGAGNAKSQRFDVTPDVPAGLVFKSQPTDIVAGKVFPSPIIVEWQDRFGNLATAVTARIQVAVIDADGKELWVPGDGSSTGGVHSYSGYNLTKAGTQYRLKAKSSTYGFETISSSYFSIAPDVSAALWFTSNTNQLVAGELFAAPLAVSILDGYGNVVPTATDTITLTLHQRSQSAQQTGLIGTTSVAAVNGVATFPTVSVTRAASSTSGGLGYYELLATSGSLTTRRSTSFNVLPAAAAALSITVQPVNRALGYALAPTLEVTTQDIYGNAATEPVVITASLQTNAAGAVLSGTLQKSTSNGKVTFNDLTLDKAGNGFTLSFSAPSIAPVVSNTFDVVPLVAQSSLATGPNHLCGVRPDLSIACWGQNFSGQLGTGSNITTPAVTTELGMWSAVYAGTNVVCASKPDGSLWCRGANTAGMLGDGTFVNKNVFTREVTNSTWKTVAIGGSHVCGVKSDSSLWCWGAGGLGQRGDGRSGAVADSAVPTREQTASSWKTVAAGLNHTCGIMTDGSLWCWGAYSSGQLGNNPIMVGAPIRESSGSSWTAVACGAEHTCGIKTDGSLWCWGKDDYRGVLGSGSPLFDPSITPVQEASKSTWRSVSAGTQHTCAVRTNGSLWCWGVGNCGEMGNGRNDATNPSPVQEITSTTWTAVVAGDRHTCGLRQDRTVWCWGNGSEGQTAGNSSTSSPAREKSNSLWGP